MVPRAWTEHFTLRKRSSKRPLKVFLLSSWNFELRHSFSSSLYEIIMLDPRNTKVPHTCLLHFGFSVYVIN